MAASKLLSRLKHLEALSQDARQSVMQVGSLKKLPDDFVGERHVVVVNRKPTGMPKYESCEFEERPGPEPPGLRDQACRVYVTEDDRGLL
jgi:hypothetical protein